MPVLLVPTLLVLLLGLPWLGVRLLGTDASRYLEFPPLTRYVQHADFSWPVFVALSLVIAAVLSPFVFRLIVSSRTVPARSLKNPFPWWGWAGLVLTAAAWFLAWTRFSWFAQVQPFIFPLLWLGYILTVNAWTCRRTGTCLLQRSPAGFVLLFPLSMVFWWFFEYLNRFVQNWYYVGIQGFSAGEYLLYASLSFATVLPAVLGTRELLLSTRIFQSVFGRFRSLRPAKPKPLALGVLVLAGLGLALIGIFPDVLFPLLWVAPLLIVVSVLTLAGRKHMLHALQHGDWSLVLASASAALVCGFFWEMWNVYSLPKWKYSIPYVQAFHVFEMPVLGYAGYLPFGLECAVLAEVFLGSRVQGARPLMRG